jgi:uncharacterized protein DUF4350
MFMHSDAGTSGRGDVPRPTSEERRANGYNGAMAWLDEQHVRTVSVRERFNKLAIHPGLAATGNLLIVTLPAATSFKTEELRPLERWVQAGNTLLVLAALSDDPDWAFVLGRPVSGDLGLLTGLEFEVARRSVRRPATRGAGSGGDSNAGTGAGASTKGGTDEVGARIAATARAFAQPQPGTLVPNGSHPYFSGVSSAVALSDYPSQPWTVKIPYDGFVLSLAHQQETGDGVLWTRPLGSGRIIVSGLGSLFTNRVLGLADNGRLLANVVGATVGSRGAVLFDDMHQGLGAAYDPAKFYSDRRLYETVGILAGLWLCWVLGATQLQLPGSRAAAPREAELVQVTGGFLARVLTPDAGARGLFEHFFRRLRARLGDGKSEPPWELLERLAHGSPGLAHGSSGLAHGSSGPAGVSAAQLRQLKDWYADACAARAVPLGPLQNLMVSIEKHLSA